MSAQQHPKARHHYKAAHLGGSCAWPLLQTTRVHLLHGIDVQQAAVSSKHMRWHCPHPQQASGVRGRAQLQGGLPLEGAGQPRSMASELDCVRSAGAVPPLLLGSRAVAAAMRAAASRRLLSICCCALLSSCTASCTGRYRLMAALVAQPAFSWRGCCACAKQLALGATAM